MTAEESYDVAGAALARLQGATRALLDDMVMRARLRGDVDPDGTAVLDCDASVLRRVMDELL